MGKNYFCDSSQKKTAQAGKLIKIQIEVFIKNFLPGSIKERLNAEYFNLITFAGNLLSFYEEAAV